MENKKVIYKRKLIKFDYVSNERKIHSANDIYRIMKICILNIKMYKCYTGLNIVIFITVFIHILVVCFKSV